MPADSNSLAHASSAYLRSAMHQPIQWFEWGEAAFAAAREQNKPVLLDIGAVWCHWCHVMDRESYENAETAAIINREFIPVKVDPASGLVRLPVPPGSKRGYYFISLMAKDREHLGRWREGSWTFIIRGNASKK